jgi:hypothetical protein
LIGCGRQRIPAQADLDLPHDQNEVRDQVCLQRVPQHLQSGRLLDVCSTSEFHVNGPFTSFGLQHLHPAISQRCCSIDNFFAPGCQTLSPDNRALSNHACKGVMSF